MPDEAPLLFYERIAKFGKENLKAGGQLYFEINQYLGTEVVQLLREHNYEDVELKLDLFGKDRMVRAVFPAKTL